MLSMMVMLYSWIWKTSTRYAPKRWRQGVVANLFKTGGKADPGNCGGITLLRTVGKTFCKISNDRMGTMMKEEEYVYEGQASFRPNRSYVDRTYTLRNTIQSIKDAGITACCLFLDIQKVYDTGWRNGLTKNVVGNCVQRKMWRIVENMTECARRAVMLDGGIVNYVDTLKGFAQKRTLSYLFKVYAIVAIEAATQGVPVGEDTVSNLMLAN